MLVTRRSAGYTPGACGIVLGLVYRKDKFKELGLEADSCDVLWNPKLAGRVALGGYIVPNTQGLLRVVAPFVGGDDMNQVPAIDQLAKIKVHSHSIEMHDLVVDRDGAVAE